MDDLRLEIDSSFVFRHLAIRYGMGDATVILSKKGKWNLNKNKLILYSHELTVNKVDSAYTLIPNSKNLVTT